MQNKFVKSNNNSHQVETNFFKELMVLCAQYGVKLTPNVFYTNDSENTEYPAIEFEFRNSSFINTNIDAGCYTVFKNIDNENDYIEINAIPCDEQKIWYNKVNKELSDGAYKVLQKFNDKD